MQIHHRIAKQACEILSFNYCARSCRLIPRQVPTKVGVSDILPIKDGLFREDSLSKDLFCTLKEYLRRAGVLYSKGHPGTLIMKGLRPSTDNKIIEKRGTEGPVRGTDCPFNCRKCLSLQRFPLRLYLSGRNADRLRYGQNQKRPDVHKIVLSIRLRFPPPPPKSVSFEDFLLILQLFLVCGPDCPDNI